MVRRLGKSDDPLLMNIKITPSNPNIEFRFPQYLPPTILEKLKWQSASWAYANYKLHGQAAVVEMIRSYLQVILPDYRRGKVKAGGKSSAEALIRRHLERVFPDIAVMSNTRLDHLRSAKGRPLEFDLWLPEMKLAIEVQGPQHFKEVYGNNDALIANDRYKREWCADQGIKLVWMNWDGVTTGLFRIPEDEQRRHLGELLVRFLASVHSFLWWKGIDSHVFA